METTIAAIEALGVVDRNSLAGIVRALEASRATGLRLVIGCRLEVFGDRAYVPLCLRGRPNDQLRLHQLSNLAVAYQSPRSSSLPDAFLPSLRLERRDALWAIKALRNEPLPLFAAAAEREARVIAEQQEPEVELRQMTEGTTSSRITAIPA
ncbi:hypothetical protein AJ87_41495 [Rhizobium yanglingense]|nr:hypothetical protein AJ87_41495 [Rhizobium yanglingense]